MKLRDYLLQAMDSTEGERALLRIADAIEAGRKPEDSDAQRLIDAALLLRLMIQDGESIEGRREEFTRKVGMHKPPKRPKKTATVRDVLERGETSPAGRAMAYWMARANGAGVNEAIRQAMEATGKGRSTIKRAIEAHPEARETVRMTYQELAAFHLQEHGTEHPGLQMAVARLGP